METLERIIAEHPFFADLDAAFTGLMVGCASNVRFKRGIISSGRALPPTRFI